MSQVIPSTDRAMLARMDDDALNSRILLNSVSTYMGLCEQLRRMDQLRKAHVAADEALKKSDKEIASLRKRLADAKASMGPGLEAVEAKGKAAVEEAAKLAAEAAERARSRR
ncbi:unnamed protein product [Cuscuta europaea]|uniref:Uncharacterized protein n=1 Tax=Cuscuta europaea TaxID=41803 RepID=A0A9P1EFW8_CUSEU|nr:unnamed protein product [Cuscuta europaea]